LQGESTAHAFVLKGIRKHTLRFCLNVAAKLIENLAAKLVEKTYGFAKNGV